MYVDINKIFVWLIFAKKSPLAGLGLYCKFLEQLSNFFTYVCELRKDVVTCIISLQKCLNITYGLLSVCVTVLCTLMFVYLYLCASVSFQYFCLPIIFI